MSNFADRRLPAGLDFRRPCGFANQIGGTLSHVNGTQTASSNGTEAPAATLPECDLVMKGGITSGIIYPGLVTTLSTHYRFRQIGGASAGAIAATMAAAAEAGRRSEKVSTTPRAFDKLAAIPGELREDLPKLFQPSPKAATAFDVLMAWIAPGRTAFMKSAAVIGVVVRRAFGWFVVALLIAMIPAVAFDLALLGVPRSGHDWFALTGALLVWLPAALIVGAAAAAVAKVRATVAALNDNGFGLCNGLTRRPGIEFDPLTVWMEKSLRDVAGMSTAEGAPPVCLRDLWGEAATSAYRDALEVGQGEAANIPIVRRRELRELRWTDCLVMTTDVSHRRPYRFPFETAEFFWCPLCLGDYFPANVIAEMVGATVEVVRDDVETWCPHHKSQEQRVLHMPLAPDIPVVVAARISLSFPALISAVPLQTVDYGRGPDEPHHLVTVWLSDGGIASNFPMRFFDVAWPQRPTFGINLAPPHPGYPEEMVWRAPPGQSGRFPRYGGTSTLGEFAASIFDTMQNWSDSMQITMPGFRDRVVEIRQNPDEGGMNLQMGPEVIDRLAARGTQAGNNILNGDATTPPFNFRLHRWMRYRDAMASLDDFLSGMLTVWPDQQAFLDSLPGDWNAYPAGANDRQATDQTMAFAGEIGALGHPATAGTVPRPQPDLRLVPPL
jgi:predicted acylesterase/phospholipase RssA